MIHCQKILTLNCRAFEAGHVSYDTMRRSSGSSSHEFVLLTQFVQFRVAIEHASSDELVEDSEHDWRKNREDDVVEREGPALFKYLARERVLEGKLSRETHISWKVHWFDWRVH